MGLSASRKKKFQPKNNLQKLLLYKLFFSTLCLIWSISISANSFGAEVEVSFDKSPDKRVVGYKIYYGISPNFDFCMVLGADTNCSLFNLEEGAAYVLAATGYDQYGNESAFSDVIEFQASSSVDENDQDESNESDGADEQADDSFSIKIEFDASPDARVIGYRMYWGISRIFEKSKDLGNETRCILSGFQEGSTYYFAAKGYDRSGFESDFSEVLAYEVPMEGFDGGNLATSSEAPDDVISEKSSSDVAVLECLASQKHSETDWDGMESEANMSCSECSSSADPEEIINVAANSVPSLYNLLETGEILVDHEWTTIIFEQRFENPIVVAKLASSNDPEPAIAKIRNVHPEGFEIRIQEWDCWYGAHGLESVNYIAMEKGSYLLPGDIPVEAGSISAENYYRLFYFESPFESAPVVVTSVTTRNQESPVGGRLEFVHPQFFGYRLQEQAPSCSDNRFSETVHYIAWAPSMGKFGGLTFEASITGGEDVASSYRYIPYRASFSTAPLLFAEIIGYGNEGAVYDLVERNITCDGFEMRSLRFRRGHGEILRSRESVGYLLMEMY